MKIVLAGAGNVASHLGPLLKKKGHKIVQVYNRSKKNGTALATKLRCKFTNNISEIIPDADVYIVALRDEAIKSFTQKLPFIPGLIVHTSGSCSISIFPEKMKNTGVFYPLQTFSKNHSTPSRIPICIEGSNTKSLSTLKKLASGISKDVYVKNSAERELIHLAAVLSNNFTNHLFSLSKQILKDDQTPFEILKPLILETALKIQDGDPAAMQTGPARRGDFVIIKKHLKMLKKYPGTQDLYKKFSKSIAKEYIIDTKGKI